MPTGIVSVGAPATQRFVHSLGVWRPLAPGLLYVFFDRVLIPHGGAHAASFRESFAAVSIHVVPSGDM